MQYAGLNEGTHIDTISYAIMKPAFLVLPEALQVVHSAWYNLSNREQRLTCVYGFQVTRISRCANAVALPEDTYHQEHKTTMPEAQSKPDDNTLDDSGSGNMAEVKGVVANIRRALEGPAGPLLVVALVMYALAIAASWIRAKWHSELPTKSEIQWLFVLGGVLIPLGVAYIIFNLYEQHRHNSRAHKEIEQKKLTELIKATQNETRAKVLREVTSNTTASDEVKTLAEGYEEIYGYAANQIPGTSKIMPLRMYVHDFEALFNLNPKQPTKDNGAEQQFIDDFLKLICKRINMDIGKDSKSKSKRVLLDIFCRASSNPTEFLRIENIFFDRLAEHYAAGYMTDDIARLSHQEQREAILGILRSYVRTLGTELSAPSADSLILVGRGDAHFFQRLDGTKAKITTLKNEVLSQLVEYGFDKQIEDTRKLNLKLLQDSISNLPSVANELGTLYESDKVVNYFEQGSSFRVLSLNAHCLFKRQMQNGKTAEQILSGRTGVRVYAYTVDATSTELRAWAHVSNRYPDGVFDHHSKEVKRFFKNQDQRRFHLFYCRNIPAYRLVFIGENRLLVSTYDEFTDPSGSAMRVYELDFENNAQKTLFAQFSNYFNALTADAREAE